MNIIDERNIRTIYRKLRKKEFDERMTLSVSNADTVRLLDEGVVVDASGNALFYIKKGTLAAYYESLPDDYVGTVNLGHMDFATFPFILGTWTKKDLHLVDIGDGRKALNVDLRLDEESFIVKELRRQNFTLGVSAEFGFHVDERNSRKFGLEMLDKVFIGNFAIVGEAGNVNSSDIRLGGTMTMKDLTAAIESAESTNLEEVNKKLDALLEAEPVEDPQEGTEEPQEAPEEPQEAQEEPAGEEPQEDEEKPAEEAGEAAEEASEEAEQLSAVAAAMETLVKENAELKARNEKLTAKLAARDKAEQDFLARFKKLSVSVASTERVTMEEAEAPVANVFTDGIGEI